MAAVTAGRTWAAGSTVATATPTVAFKSTTYTQKNGGTSNGESFKAVRFVVDPASASALDVNIPFLHGLSYITIPVGAFAASSGVNAT